MPKWCYLILGLNYRFAHHIICAAIYWISMALHQSVFFIVFVTFTLKENNYA